jgi:hypothetical protein
MNFCKPSSSQSPAPPPSAPPLSPYSGDPYNNNYRQSATAAYAAEDYGLSSSFFQDNTDGNNNNSNKPKISSVSGSDRVSQEYGAINGGGGQDDGKNNSSNSNSNSNNKQTTQNYNGGSNMRGDVNIRPNTGNSNQSAGTVLGSLREITTFLRWTSILSTICCVIWEGFAFPMRLIGSILTHPAQVVLGAYLGFFCLLILGVELNAPLQDNFGFLYDPLSRGFILLMMSGMSIGILNSWWESLLGLALGLVGIGYIYTYITYPEYRRWQNYNERLPTAWQEAKMYWSNRSGRRGSSAWADPNSNNRGEHNNNLMGIAQTASEARSLLHHV